jgi:protein SCO1/2
VVVTCLWALAGVSALAMGGTAMLLRAKSQGSLPPQQQLLAPDSSTAAGDNGQGMPVLFDAPSFALHDQNGSPFSSGQLHGKVWVADFIFTHCTSLCPLMTRNLATFQKMTADVPAIAMVSFTVDPDRDTPAVLHDYADANQANGSRWHFLTGTRDQTWDISKAMKLAVEPDRGSQVMHSSHFLLVDGNGKVRGVYDSNTAGFLTQLVADAKRLASGAEKLD